MTEPEHGRHPAALVKRSLLAVFVLAAVSVLLLSAPVSAQEDAAEVVGFDDYPANISGSGAAEPITDEYASQGLIFPNGATALVFNDSSFPPRPDLPRSGDTIITSCYAGEFCSSTITMEFDPPLTELTIFAGYSRSLDQSADLLLEGYNRDGEVIVRSISTIPAADQAIPTRNPVTIQDSSGEIAGAQVRWVDEQRFLGELIVDDITLRPFVPAAELSAEPSPIELEVESDAATVTVELSNTGNVPLTGLFFTLDGFDQLVDETETTIEVQPNSECLQLIEVDGSCLVSISATPEADITTAAELTGALVVRTVSGAPILEAPVTIAVIPPPSVPDTLTEETTETTNETTTPTVTEQPVTTAPSTPPDPPPDPPPPPLPPFYIIGGLILLGLVLRRMIRRSKKPSQPPPPPPPQQPRSQEQRPSEHVPRPSLSVKPDSGTQTIETHKGAPHSLTVALNSQTSTTTLIEHHERTGQ